MKKLRIVKLTSNTGSTSFLCQKRVLLFFWQNITYRGVYYGNFATLTANFSELWRAENFIKNYQEPSAEVIKSI